MARLESGITDLPDTTLPGRFPPGDSPPPWSGPAFRHGVVTTTEPLAALAGAEVLRRGGNAIDAAAAVQFMLNVVEPQSSGIGGGSFIMIHRARTDETFVIDARETAPAASTPDMFVSQPSMAIRSTSGYAVAVPGTLRGFALALEHWGTISLAEALEPAIQAAEEGIPVSSRLAADLLSSRLANEPGNPAYEEARSVFRPGGMPLQEGDILVQQDLADTFRLIAEYGVDAFYDCDSEAGIAQALIQAQLATRSSNPAGVGRMTCGDLAAYEPVIREPIAREYRDYTIVTTPPPSSGGIGLLQMLGMLERFSLGSESFGFGQLNTLNVMQEAMRLAFADRAFWVGDEDFVDVPVAGLLADDYLAQRSALIQVGQRLASVTPGSPLPYDGTGLTLTVDEEEGVNTTHFTIVDRRGNIASVTSTIESTWGTGLMVTDAGFLLNNEMTDFNRVPMFVPGVNPGANDVAPGKRPRSSMAPTLIFFCDEPVAAYGSPGGATIINTLLNFTINLIDHDMTLQQAVVAPRFSLTSPASTAVTEIEPGFDPDVLAMLQALGYRFELVDDIGAVQAIIVRPHTGKQYGAADPRRIGGVAAPRRSRRAE